MYHDMKMAVKILLIVLIPKFLLHWGGVHYKIYLLTKYTPEILIAKGIGEQLSYMGISLK